MSNDDSINEFVQEDEDIIQKEKKFPTFALQMEKKWNNFVSPSTEVCKISKLSSVKIKKKFKLYKIQF
ncbi:hypothetical protein BpHYR1_017948 [Brachionus plicatilis]|uniref:Uncharacterized protein n=1 Tax=Brachionus plicatilis TaxID=10195 RepID=A0A3M7P357_BRAPC|nr:hypothetical protein BpHYR1_017948 [Brachionus plicatilis]